MPDIAERESIYRLLSTNDEYRRIARRVLELEIEEKSQQREYPWLGAEWNDIPANATRLRQMVVDGILVTGGIRQTIKTNSTTTFKVKDPELIQECLDAIDGGNGGEDETIPDNLFDFIIGHDNLKDLVMKSVNADKPVHILLVGPPGGAKSMILSELNRLPSSRFTVGGGTSKAGLADYILEFHPRYLIIDEIDKMPKDEQSILLSLMESGVVARLKKKMREIETVKTWVFAAANRDNLWPELRSRFFVVHLKPYSQKEFESIVNNVLTNREKVEPRLATYIASRLSPLTQDIRDAIQIGILAKSQQDVDELMKLKWPK